jgi:EAL domain-containing protein (putative c-di-GMP-specific phosphodiesterase class I)
MAETKLQELPYERIAMSGGEMPKGLKYHDQMTFQRLRNLYHAYKQQIVSREVASKEKMEILRERDNLKFMCDLFEENVEMTKKTELVISDFRKTRKIEYADMLCDILEGRKFNVR